MNKSLILGMLLALSACANNTPKETYPYGMSEKEWNELSIKDKAAIRRDFYFYEKGNIDFVNPQLSVEGKKDLNSNVFVNKKLPAPKAVPLVDDHNNP